jgi:hypothetical protein
MDRNRQAALDACEKAHSIGRLTGETVVPITPLVNFPYLDENDQTERGQALNLGLAFLSRCDELWVSGGRVSEGMRGEIRAAVRMGKPVYSMGMEQAAIQEAVSNLPPMLTEKHCFKDGGNRDFKNQLLVLKESALATWAKEPENQLWRGDGGFGLSKDARGRAVYATNVFDGEKARFNREDFHGVCNPERLPPKLREQAESMDINENEELEDQEL